MDTSSNDVYCDNPSQGRYDYCVSGDKGHYVLPGGLCISLSADATHQWYKQRSSDIQGEHQPYALSDFLLF